MRDRFGSECLFIFSDEICNVLWSSFNILKKKIKIPWFFTSSFIFKTFPSFYLLVIKCVISNTPFKDHFCGTNRLLTDTEQKYYPCSLYLCVWYNDQALIALFDFHTHKTNCNFTDFNETFQIDDNDINMYI